MLLSNTTYYCLTDKEALKAGKQRSGNNNSYLIFNTYYMIISKQEKITKQTHLIS